MAGIFSPQIAKLVDIGKSVALGDEESIGELGRVADECLEYLNSFENTFKGVIPFLKEETDEIKDYILQDFRDLKNSINDLKNVMKKGRMIELNPIIFDLERLAFRFAESINSFSALTDRIESPIPVANLIIKLSYNITEHRASAENLKVLLPPLAVFVSNTEKNIKSFKVIHPAEVKIYETADKLINDLKNAVGALKLFIEKEDYSCLIDGVRILKYASTSLYVVLRLMDSVSSAEKKYSKIAVLEEYCKLYEQFLNGKVSAKNLYSAFLNVDELANIYVRSVDFMKKSHYRHFIKKQLDETSSKVSAFKRFWDSTKNQMFDKMNPRQLPISSLKSICSEFEEAEKYTEKLSLALKNEFDKVSKTPYMEEIKDIIGRYLSGVVVLEYFSTRLEDFAMRHQDLLFQFREKSYNDRTAMEVYELLELQKTGIDELLMFLDDSDKEHLIRGFRDVESSLPRLFEIQQGISPMKKSSRLLCPGCGREAPVGERLCPFCGAVIPKGMSTNLSGSSYEEFFEEQALPARVELLFTAFNSFRVGEISKKDLLSEFSKYKNLVKQVRREFSVKSNELFNGEYAEEAHAMESGLRTLDTTLEKIIEMLETGRDITDAMSDLRMAGYYLEDIRARIS